MKARHGLVIGKFYPPHAGHHLLVRTAARASERVTVLVMASSVETISLDDRVRWMREVHAGEPQVKILGARDDVRVDYEDEAVWAEHVAIMQRALADAGGPDVDAVFTSEAYGPELAHRLRARHVAVDPSRVHAPISGTAVRRDPAGAWDLLEKPVQAGLALRVVVLGAESTGKSTLALELADCLRQRGGAWTRTRVVPEKGRDLALEKLLAHSASAQLEGRPVGDPLAFPWSAEDFVEIARAQARLEDTLASEGGPALICDTDVFTTSVWAERYLGAPVAEVEALAAPRRAHLVLLTHPDDVPFHQDGTRDGEHVRESMTRRFAEKLAQQRRPFTWLRGAREARRARAVELVADALAARRFADPLG